MRKAETIRDVDRINAEIGAGKIAVIRTCERNPELEMRSLILRSRVHGIYVQVPSRVVFLQYGRGKKDYTEDEWELVSEVTTYARPERGQSGWGAYTCIPQVACRLR